MTDITPSRSLTDLCDWARDKSTEIAIPVNERGLWKQIADEIDAFTGHAIDAEPAPATSDLFGGDF